MARIEPVGSGSSTDRVGWVRVTDIQPQSGGVVIDKTYDDPPGNSLLISCTSSTSNVRVILESSYPHVRVEYASAILPRVGEMYQGSVSLALSSSIVEVETTDPNGNPAALERVTVNLNPPPSISSLVFFGGYPGSQTELKENDAYLVSGLSDKLVDLVEVADYEAGKFQQTVIAPALSFLVSVAIANRGTSSVLRPARVRVRDAVTGAFSDYKDTNEGGSVEGVNLVKCNNTYPTTSISSVTYPPTQQALKNSEQASVYHSISNYDTVAYSVLISGQLNIPNPSIYESPKVVTRTGGDYNVSSPNLRIAALRNANAASSIVDYTIKIAHVAASVNIVEPSARLRSGGNDGTSPQDHVISVVSNQQLLGAPSLDPDLGGSRGIFIGSWYGGPLIWLRLFRVQDTDEKGTFHWANLVATNLAGIVTTSITGDDSYVLGGFVSRTVVWDAFQTVSRDLNVRIQDFSKISAGLWSATDQPSIRWPIGTPPSKQDGYTVQAVGVVPTKVIWLDSAAASSNTGEAYLFGFEEMV